MKSKTNLYIALGFAIFGIVQAFENNFDEATLYWLLAGAFSTTWVSMNPEMTQERKKILTIISWVLIVLSVIWFLYLVRTDAWR